MKKAALLAAFMMLMVGFMAAQDSKTEAAQKAAESWLTLVDNGDYAASYDHAASFFQSKVTKEDWIRQVGAARGPFGKIVSRRLKSAQYTTSLPSAPDGQYVVIQYDTSFENKQSAQELIVTMLDKDGQWRVSGYFVK